MTLPFCQLRILVAENGGVRQKLIARMLEEMGMAVVLASHGKEALARFAADHFDLIFMRLELRKMNSFAASAAIRRQENAFDDDAHIPIIAMTTLASSTERERCLAAGMDGYMEKPTRLSELQMALLAFANPDSLSSTEAPPKWNRAKALERVGGDESLLAELIATFAGEKSRLLGQMDRALLEQRPELLQQVARGLQEELTYLGASEVSETARQLGVTANQPDFLKATEMAVLLRFQLSATAIAMSKN